MVLNYRISLRLYRVHVINMWRKNSMVVIMIIINEQICDFVGHVLNNNMLTVMKIQSTDSYICAQTIVFVIVIVVTCKHITKHRSGDNEPQKLRHNINYYNIQYVGTYTTVIKAVRPEPKTILNCTTPRIYRTLAKSSSSNKFVYRCI